MKTRYTVGLCLALLVSAHPAFADDAKYNEHYEYAAQAKMLEQANERLSNPRTAYDDQYEYASAARDSDAHLVNNKSGLPQCGESPLCQTNDTTATATRDPVQPQTASSVQ